MKKFYLIAFMLAMITTASAQFFNMPLNYQIPVTTTIRNGETGEIIGTATRSGAITYMRDKDGELTSTATIDANGVLTYRDPSGNVTGSAIKAGDTTTYRNPDGKVTHITTAEKDGTVMTRDPDGKVINTVKTKRQ